MDPDDDLAAAIVLQPGDLGPDWYPVAIADGEGVERASRLVDEGFPHDRVVALSDSEQWQRPPYAYAYSSAVVFDGDDAAAVAVELLASSEFAAEFAADVAEELHDSAWEWLGGTVDTEAHGEVIVHHLTFVTGDEDGVRPVHVDLAVVRAGAGVTLLWAGDSPERFDPVERDRLVEVLRARGGLRR